MSRRTRLFLGGLALVVVAIVLADLWRGSRPQLPDVEPMPAPAPPEVRRGLDKSPLLYRSAFAQEVAQQVSASLLLAEPAEASGESVRALAISGSEALIAPAVAHARWRVRDQAGAMRDAQLAGADAVHGVALLRVTGPALRPIAFPRREAEWREPLVALAFRRLERPAPAARALDSPGSFEGLAAWMQQQAGSAGDLVVNLEGELMAYAATAPRGIQILGAGLVTEIVEALRGGGTHRHPWTGVHLQAIEASLRSRFPDGALVAVHVEPDSPAAGRVTPGSVFTEVRAGSQAATTPERVASLLAQAESISLVTPAGAEIEVPVGDRQQPPAFGGAPEGLQIASGEPALTVAPQSLAAARGLRTGDIIRAIDLRPPGTMAQIRTALRGSRDRLLTIQRGDDWRFVLWPGAEPSR
jgi:hypothetical protein